MCVEEKKINIPNLFHVLSFFIFVYSSFNLIGNEVNQLTPLRMNCL